jgi:hypothetical protein
MPECVRVANRGAASSRATVHSTPALSAHRWRLALSPRSASGLRIGVPGSWVISRVAWVRCSRFFTAPTPRSDVTYDRLPTSMDVDVLDRDALLPLAAVTVEGFGQSRVGPGELARLGQVLAPSFEALVDNHRTPVALHGGAMGRDQLTISIPSSPSRGFMPIMTASIAFIWRVCSSEIAVPAPKSVSDLASEHAGVGSR